MKIISFILASYLWCITTLPVMQFVCTETQIETCCDMEAEETCENSCAEDESKENTTCCIDGICCNCCLVFDPNKQYFEFSIHGSEIEKNFTYDNNITSAYPADPWQPPEYLFA